MSRTRTVQPAACRRPRVPALLLGLLAALLAACGRPTPAIGVLLPESGPLSLWGRQARLGIELALSQVPEGRRPRVLVVDDKSTPRGASAGMESLCLQGATVVIGPLTTECALAAGLVARAERVPMLTPSATGAEVTRDNAWALRLCVTDPEVAKIMARFARHDRNLSKVAVVKDLSNRWSLGLAEAFAREFRIAHGQIVGEVVYHGGDDDRLDALDRVCALGAEAAFIPGYHDDVVAMLRSARDPRVADLVLLGADGWAGDELPTLVPGRVRQAFHAAHMSPEEGRPGMAAFVRDYTALAGEPPGDFGALGYDAARAVLSVYDASRDGTELRDALLGLHVFDALTGTVRMDAAGSPESKSLVILQLHDPKAPRFFQRCDA